MSLRERVTDAAYRTVYRTGHRVLREWWRVREPRTSGALAAIWYRGEVLLVRNSYRTDHTLPGGFVRPGERPERAVVRELREETSIVLDPARFQHAYRGTHFYEHRVDTVDIYEAELETLPPVRIDGREVIWAGFRTPADARAMRIVPHLADYLAGR
jgi:8-oxo-dGTP diphosphatase